MHRSWTSRRGKASYLVLQSLIWFLVAITRSYGLQLQPRISKRSTSQSMNIFCSAFAASWNICHHDTGIVMASAEDSSGSSQPDETNTPETPIQSRKQHVVRWETANGIIEFPAYDGETLGTAALRRGVVSPHNGRAQLINCRGLGTCGTCAVEIRSGKIPSERNTKEKLRLSFPPHGSKDQSPSLRLACQVQVVSDLEVTKHSGFWGQDPEELSTSNDCKTYFGDLEFILDDKSPALDDNSEERTNS